MACGCRADGAEQVLDRCDVFGVQGDDEFAQGVDCSGALVAHRGGQFHIVAFNCASHGFVEFFGVGVGQVLAVDAFGSQQWRELFHELGVGPDSVPDFHSGRQG